MTELDPAGPPFRSAFLYVLSRHRMTGRGFFIPHAVMALGHAFILAGTFIGRLVFQTPPPLHALEGGGTLRTELDLVIFLVVDIIRAGDFFFLKPVVGCLSEPPPPLDHLLVMQEGLQQFFLSVFLWLASFFFSSDHYPSNRLEEGSVWGANHLAEKCHFSWNFFFAFSGGIDRHGTPPLEFRPE